MTVTVTAMRTGGKRENRSCKRTDAGIHKEPSEKHSFLQPRKAARRKQKAIVFGGPSNGEEWMEPVPGGNPEKNELRNCSIDWF